MKNILIVAYDYPPINNGGVQRVRAFKKYLPRYGWSTDILTTNSFGITKDEKGVYRFPDKGHDISHKSFPLKAYPYKVIRECLVRSGVVSDWFYLWKSEIKKNIDKQINLNKYDYIMASYPSVSNLELGEFLSCKYKIPLIVDYRDGLMYEPFDLIKKRPLWYRNRLHNLENRLAEIASFQLVVNEDMYAYYSKLNQGTYTITNGFDDEEQFNEEGIDLPVGFNILYTGSLSLSRSVYATDEVKKMISQINDVNFVFVGRYDSDEIRELSKIPNVIIHDAIPRNKIIPTQRKANMLLLLSGEDSSGTSGKLYEYIFSDKPILNIGGNNIASKTISDTNSGETFRIDDLQSIRQYIDKIKGGLEKKRNRNVEQYTRKYQCEKLAQILDGKEIAQ